MRRIVVSCAIALGPTWALAACEDSASSPEATPAEGGSPDVVVRRGDASVELPADASDAAVGDANRPDARDGGDAGPNALYVHINQTLASVNPTTGSLTDLGNTGELYLTLAWDSVAAVARVIKDGYSPTDGGAATPRLGTIDLCTGVVSDGPAITINGTPVYRAEGLAQDPTTGTFYVAVGIDNPTTPSSGFLTERNGTIDVATGAVTVHGQHQTLQDDGDVLMFIGPTLKLFDVGTILPNSALYTLDKTTGATSAPLATPSTLLRVTYDPTRDIVFTAVGSGPDGAATSRSIGTLNRTTGANTPLGTTVTDGTYGGGLFNALLSAPVCL